jgi:hypothetical protein
VSDFFDKPPSAQTNRPTPVTDCPACQGHRLVEVEDDVYARCPTCNPAPTSERAPVEVDAWWKQ